MNASEIQIAQAKGLIIHSLKKNNLSYKRVYKELMDTAGGSPKWKIRDLWILRNNQVASGGNSNRRGEFEENKKHFGGSSLWLFHGTPPGNLVPILMSALKPSTSGAYGPGIYFTPNSAVASSYAFKGGGSYGYLLSCRVALGKNYSKNSTTNIGSYDAIASGGNATSKDKHDSWVFLVRSSKQVYVRFITLITT